MRLPEPVRLALLDGAMRLLRWAPVLLFAAFLLWLVLPEAPRYGRGGYR
jgi:hypothetical protein